MKYSLLKKQIIRDLSQSLRKSGLLRPKKEETRKAEVVASRNPFVNQVFFVKISG